MQQAVFGFFTCEHGLSLHITTVVQIWTYIWTVVQKDRSRSNYFQLAKIYFFPRSTNAKLNNPRFRIKDNKLTVQVGPL